MRAECARILVYFSAFIVSVILIISVTLVGLGSPLRGSLVVERAGERNIVLYGRCVPPNVRFQYEYWIEPRFLGKYDRPWVPFLPDHYFEHQPPSRENERYYGKIDIRFSLWWPGIFFSIWPIISIVRYSRKKRLIADRLRRGECTKCGYDLRGTNDGVCSECGTPFGGQRLPLRRESKETDRGC